MSNQTRRPFFKWLREQGFTLVENSRGPNGLAVFEKVIPGQRQIDVQLWNHDNFMRACHWAYGKYGFVQKTTPTTFSSLEGMKEAINYESTRPAGVQAKPKHFR